MFSHLDIATVYTCMFLIMIVASCSMTAIWINKKDDRAIGSWMLSFVSGVAAVLVLALLHILGPAALIASSLFSVLTYSLLYSGFRHFAGQPHSALAVFAAPVGYLSLLAVWPWIYQDLSANTAVISGTIATLMFVSVWSLFQNAETRKLPMVYPVSIVMTSHGLFRISHVYFMLFDPFPIENGRFVSVIWNGLVLEIFLSVCMLAIATLLLIRDRSEQHLRLAAETDYLTGIYNRRAFIARAEQVLSKADPSVALAVLDLDLFKQINDSFGHDVGDKVLVACTDTIREKLPEGALFGRMGGEEFAILLPKGASDASSILDEIRHAVELVCIKHKDICISVTLSIGFTNVRQAGNNFDVLFAAADQALYEAKRRGRNQVVKLSLSGFYRSLDARDAAELPLDNLQADGAYGAAS